MHPTSGSALLSLDVRLRPEELAVAWRPESRRLVLPAKAPLRLQQKVAARITAVGLGVAATITGRVVSAGPHGDRFRIELAPDEARMRAVERLMEIARGGAVRYHPRIPRFLASLPAFVSGPRQPTYMNTFSVSENGCGLVWSGPVPAAGATMDVRLGAGNRAATFRAVVCWTSQSGRSATVGLRFVSGPQQAWSTILAERRRAGAPLA